MSKSTIGLAALLCLQFSYSAYAFTDIGKCHQLISSEQERSIIVENLPFGMPTNANDIEINHAYVTAYDDNHHVPQYVAWRAIEAYMDTPQGIDNKYRYGTWGQFRTDPRHSDVTPGDYKGWYKESDIILGHMAPYFISGGDRNGDGRDAEIEGSSNVEDQSDACSVFEINSMANISPQYHATFNAKTGAWYKLEADVRKLLHAGKNLNIIAGTIFLPGEPVKWIGDRKANPDTWNIGVPHGLYKIIYDNEAHQAFAFLFGHDMSLPYGCDTRTADGNVIPQYPSSCIVDISEIESLSNIDFFASLNDSDRDTIFRNNTKSGWTKTMRSTGDKSHQ